MLTISPIQQVQNDPRTPAYIRDLPFSPDQAPRYCIAISGDTFGGRHPAMQLLDAFHPVLCYVEEEATILLFAANLEEAECVHQAVRLLLKTLPWPCRVRLWWREFIPNLITR